MTIASSVTKVGGTYTPLTIHFGTTFISLWLHVIPKHIPTKPHKTYFNRLQNTSTLVPLIPYKCIPHLNSQLTPHALHFGSTTWVHLHSSELVPICHCYSLPWPLDSGMLWLHSILSPPTTNPPWLGLKHVIWQWVHYWFHHNITCVITYLAHFIMECRSRIHSTLALTTTLMHLTMHGPLTLQGQSTISFHNNIMPNMWSLPHATCIPFQTPWAHLIFILAPTNGHPC
jgi:hypothetical protein